MDHNVAFKKIILVYKHSRLDYAREKNQFTALKKSDKNGQELIKEFTRSHENNLRCIEFVREVLDDMALPYELICRSEIKREDFNNKFVISIGGDGTLLAASHFCLDSPVLGVNSDPDTSIGALCIANKYNFRELINKIYANLIKPDPIQRLEIFYQDKLYNILALNDILYCHNNPAAMSRFSLSMGDQSEAHRASGVWVSSAAGSTGGIFSCGSPNYPIESQQALFRVREPYWCDHAQPALLAGSFKNQEFLYITSNMTDARIYIDGPHQFFDVRLGEVVKLKISSHPLWIFSAKELNQKREQIIIPRLAFRDLLYGEDRA